LKDRLKENQPHLQQNTECISEGKLKKIQNGITGYFLPAGVVYSEKGIKKEIGFSDSL